MALTPLQRNVCRLLATRPSDTGDRYLAGGVALNEWLHGERLSHDVDIFHDSAEALRASWAHDRVELARAGLKVEVLRELPGFVQVVVGDDSAHVVIEWIHDSVFRFFPLQRHPQLGLTLHPFDLATNKVLALASRREPRDLVDLLRCDERLQPLGYLAWAAAGKDPGFSPLGIIETASQMVRYQQAELDTLEFDGTRPDAADLSRRWHAAAQEARAIISLLPAEHAGECVLDGNLELVRASSTMLKTALPGELRFHAGRPGGSLP